MARILIGWESGTSSTLLWDAATIGRTLSEAGHEIHYALGDPIAFLEFGEPGPYRHLWQAPTVPGAPQLLMRPPKVASLSDLMALAGFNRAARLTTLAQIWAGLIETLAPAAIIAIGAPVLTMVGPTRAPTLLSGDNQALPPILHGAFPRQAADIAPVTALADMVDNANAALSAIGGRPIDVLADLHSRCREIRYGLSLLDPYLPLRRGPSLGLLGGAAPFTLPPIEPRLAVYLDVNCPNIEAFAVALAGLEGMSADVCIKGAPEGMSRYLAGQAQLRYFDSYTALAAQTDAATCIIHHGVPRLAELALTAGRQQLIVPWTGEHSWLLGALKTLGVAWEKAPTASLAEIATTMIGLPNDASAAANARHVGQQLADLQMEDATRKIAAAVAETV